MVQTARINREIQLFWHKYIYNQIAKIKYEYIVTEVLVLYLDILSSCQTCY